MEKGRKRDAFRLTSPTRQNCGTIDMDISHSKVSASCKTKKVTGLPEIEQMNDTCEACVIGKHHRVPFPKRSKWRSTEKLQLIYSDLCRPITPSSNSQMRYLLSFIDDFSRKTWIYFVAEKSETFHQFKIFKALVEKQSGCVIKCLRTDRGGEYNSIEFKEFCRENGIKRQLTTAYTP